jgi:hypothetical protein
MWTSSVRVTTGFERSETAKTRGSTRSGKVRSEWASDTMLAEGFSARETRRPQRGKKHFHDLFIGAAATLAPSQTIRPFMEL